MKRESVRAWLMRPLTRCLAFIVLSLIGIGAARAWLGEHSVLIGALSGMGTVSYTHLTLPTKA